MNLSWLLLCLALKVARASAQAQQPVQPLLKLGGCPLRYYSTGSYCLSSPSNDREAI